MLHNHNLRGVVYDEEITIFKPRAIIENLIREPKGETSHFKAVHQALSKVL